MLDGAAPVSLVVEAAPVPLPSNPAVTVTGKNVISDAARVVVDTPGKFAAEPPNDSIHTPPAERVNVQSTEAVKSGIICRTKRKSEKYTQDPCHRNIPGCTTNYSPPQ